MGTVLGTVWDIRLTHSPSHLSPPLSSQANSEEFIPIFANNPRELKAFLEHMSEVQPDSPQGVYDTLLELRLQNWAHEKEPQVSPGGGVGGTGEQDSTCFPHFFF